MTEILARKFKNKCYEYFNQLGMIGDTGAHKKHIESNALRKCMFS
jgi:hypothetical protein